LSLVKNSCQIKCVLCLLLATWLWSVSLNAQAGEWYFSWGYSKDFWTNSDIHVVQSSLNNNFIVNDVRATDDPEWDLFNHSVPGPQYNIRLGRFVNVARTWAIELNFDHTKYNTNLNQVAYVDGVIGGQPVNANKVLSATYFNYQLHNGVNHVMLNGVRRVLLHGTADARYSIAFLGKFGVGILLPHAYNVILGQSNQNDVGPAAWGNYFGWHNGWWQLDGWTLGVEGGFRFVFYRPLYLELTDKEAYTSLSQISVYQGRANQTLWLNEVILSLGLTWGR
jgi:hypothetical protein